MKAFRDVVSGNRPRRRRARIALDSSSRLQRRDFLALLSAVALGGRVRQRGPLFEWVALDHINIRATNPTRSAHFYQSLFGGDLLWIESIPPNPTSPAAESWYLGLGRQYLSISPTFPDLALGPGLDHLSPAVRGWTGASDAAAIFVPEGIEMVEGSGGWIRDPDGTVYQLRNDANASGSAMPPGQAAPRPGDAPAPGPPLFTPLGIGKLSLLTADPARTAAFIMRVFGGALASQAGGLRELEMADCRLRLIPASTSGGSAVAGMDRFSVVIEGFDADATPTRLRELGLEPHDNGRPGEVHFSDPDGVQIELMSAT